MAKISPERKERITPTIIQYYQSGKKMKHISKELKISQNCVKRILQKKSIYTPWERTWTNQQKEQAIKDYQSGITITEIAKKLHINPSSLKYHLEKHGYWKFKGTRKYTFNERFFQTIDTEEKAYWLGFIAADGNVYRNVLHIGLKSTDAHHLEKFKKHIQAENPVRIQNYKSKGKILQIARIDLYSRQTINDLKNIGIHENKTHTLSWDEITKHIPENLVRHFVRGFSDGDGCWTHMEHKYPCFQIGCASKNFIFSLVWWISAIINDQIKCSIPKDRTIWYFRIGGKNKCQSLYDAMYKNATILLERKQNAALKYLTHSPSA